MAEKRRISRGDGPGFFVAAAASAAAIFLALLMVMVLAFGLPVIKESLDGGEGSLLSWQWNAGRGQFGILPMVAGSLSAAACAAICAWPLALGLCAVNLAAGPRRGPGAWLKKALAALVRFMTAVPTVIYGFASVFLLLPLWRDFMKTGAGYGLGPTIMVLSLLILPTMVLVMEAGFKNIYARHSLAGAALGFGPFQTFVFWVLPLGRSALLSAFLLGFGRAIGDTLISLMLAGNAPQMPVGLSESFRTLTAHMALVTANEAGGQAYNSLFAAGTLVLLISCAISLSARFLNSPGRKKTWGQGGRVITRLGKVRGLSSSFAVTRAMWPAETFKPPLNCGGALPLRGAAAL
ncbi:ABC transporter permease subunit, partial [Deltaproteobacteria bacterium OttesenSCG-928-K17]|nr:ABC transporter permease subunit [Deltaproteobacteria bacterium OttesenSCG-928-K17]